MKKKDLATVTDYYTLSFDQEEEAVQPGCWRHDPDAMSRLGGSSSLATGVARVGVLPGALRRLSGKDRGETKWQFEPDDALGPSETAASSSSGAAIPTTSFVFTAMNVEQCISWSTGVTAKGALRLPEPQPGDRAAASAAGPADAVVGTAEAYCGGLRVRQEDGPELRLAIVGPEALRSMWHTVAARGGGALGGPRLTDLKSHATLLCVPLGSLSQLSKDNVRARLKSYMANAPVSDGDSDDSEAQPLRERRGRRRSKQLRLNSKPGHGEGSDDGDSDGMGGTDEGGSSNEDVTFTINVGDMVEAQWGLRDQWYDATIRGFGLTEGRWDVKFDDDDDSDRDTSPCRIRPRRGDKPAPPTRHGENSALGRRMRVTEAFLRDAADRAPPPAPKARAPKRLRRPEYEWTPTADDENAFAKMLAEGGVSDNKVASKAAWLGLLKRVGTTYFVTKGEAGYDLEEAPSTSAAGSATGDNWVRKDPSRRQVAMLLPQAADAFYTQQQQRAAAAEQSAAKRQELAQTQNAVRAARDKQLEADRATLEAARDDPGRTIYYRCDGQPAQKVPWPTLVKGIGIKSVSVRGGNKNVYVELSRNVDRSGVVLGRRGWTENTFGGTQQEWRAKYNKERPGGETKEGTEWGREAQVAWMKDKQNTNGTADPQGRATLDYEHGYAPLERLLTKSGVTLRGSVPLLATRRAGAEDVPHVTNAFTPIPGKKPNERPSCGPVRAFASPLVALLLTLHCPPLRVSPRCGTQPCIGSTNWASTTTVCACCITALMARWASRNFSGLPRCR